MFELFGLDVENDLGEFPAFRRTFSISRTSASLDTNCNSRRISQTKVWNRKRDTGGRVVADAAILESNRQVAADFATIPNFHAIASRARPRCAATLPFPSAIMPIRVTSRRVTRRTLFRRDRVLAPRRAAPCHAGAARFLRNSFLCFIYDAERVQADESLSYSCAK